MISNLRSTHLAQVLFFLAAYLYVASILLFLLLRLILRSVWWLDLLNNFVPIFFLPVIFLLPISLAIREARLLIWLLILAIIAAGWFGPYFLSKPAVLKTAQTLRIASLNADNVNTHVEAIAAWIRASSPDVVLMQETPNLWYQQNILGELNNLYPYSLSQGESANNESKVILSKFPILESSEFKLVTNDRFIHQRIVIASPLGHIVVYNIHLMPNYGDTPRLRLEPYNPLVYIALSYDESTRSVQISNLLSKVREEKLPYIVAGDFNTSNFSYLYNNLAALMKDSFRETGVGFGMTWPVAASVGLPGFTPPFLRIDYIWHSPSLKTVNTWVGDAVGSDHFPIVSDLAQ